MILECVGREGLSWLVDGWHGMDEQTDWRPLNAFLGEMCDF